ncbi:glutamine synthetase family protein [Microbacterium terregens]|uniref:Glutamine synthetase n=1 Tax=Microbacterium terregens TaxID=69363 RepID=A0ABV5SXI3_9MICO
MPDLAAEPLVIGSLVDPGGVSRAKAVPASRADAFAATGVGASPSWNVFCADDRLAFTERFSVIGDLRLRIDPAAIRDIGGGLSWGPVTVGTLGGTVAASCTRTALVRTVERLTAAGVTASVGHELEFQLFPRSEPPHGSEPPEVLSPEWSAYGFGAVVDHAAFLQGVVARARSAGLEILQLHAEWAPRQFEISLARRPPVQAADDLVLARMIVRLAARDTGFAASFSPVPIAGGASNGAHAHLSLHTAGGPLLSGGTGPHGVTDAGAAAIAGILAALPGVGAVLSGSPLSAERLRPGMWAGAHASWGLENREAALRFVAATPGTPDGANIEIKPIDASANPYLATAVVLEAALMGIETSPPLPPPVDTHSDDSAPLLPTSPEDQVARLEGSTAARRSLGPDLIEAIAAVRRMEHATWGDKRVEERVERFRFTWG